MTKLHRLIILLLGMGCGSALALDIELIWNPSPDHARLTGYRMYHALGTNAWELVGTVQGTNFTHRALTAVGLHRWRVTAFNDWAESDPSNEATFDLWKPRPPGDPKIEVRITWAPLDPSHSPTVAQLEESTALDTDWRLLYRWPLFDPCAFYRVRLN